MLSTLHGRTVDDPYRWLEDAKSPKAQAWFKGQGDAARSVLDRIDGREAIANRLTDLADAQGDAIRAVVQMPGMRLFYLKRGRGEVQYKLVMRSGLTGAEKVLVDPDRERVRSGVPHAINHFKPSWNSRYLAYGMSAGGSENASLYVLDLKDGRLTGRPVPRVDATPMNWLPNSQSLTFTQLARLAPGAPQTDTYKDSRVLWMKVGDKAKPVFDAKVTTKLDLDRLDVGEIITAPGSPWMVARTTDTTVPEGKLFVAPVAQLGQADVKWLRFATAADKVFDVALQGDALFVLSQDHAPRRKIVRVDLAKPDLARAKVVVDEPAHGVIEDFRPTPDGLLTEVRQGTAIVLRRHERGDTQGRTLLAPAAGTASLVRSPAQDTDALLYAFSSWTEPLRWYRLDGDQSVPVTLGVRTVPPGLPEVQVTEVNVPSHDGVRVPMTILHKQGLALDGHNPVLLDGYGAYGFSTSAYFSIDSMVWIERGGVMAFVNPRGSGVNGDDWHRAGFKTTKSNTWKDGIAAARYLIDKGYGSPATMGIMGTSAGGIFVGRATTEAPELFAAAVYNVGMLDTIRSEESANGITNISEFGTVKEPAEFQSLLEMSTYNAIKDGAKYPGVLLVHGMNDPRVNVWQSGKTAARLQAASSGVTDARPALLRMDMQAGHGVGSTLSQRQALTADIQSFLLWQMGKAALKH